jgi:hypothetical protein
VVAAGFEGCLGSLSNIGFVAGVDWSGLAVVLLCSAYDWLGFGVVSLFAVFCWL